VEETLLSAPAVTEALLFFFVKFVSGPPSISNPKNHPENIEIKSDVELVY
jgi:hypothetical protein